jgi:hypothetical protein
MLEVDKLILTAIESNCIDVVELLLKNRDKLCYGDWLDSDMKDYDDGSLWRSDFLGKIIKLEKANPNLPLKEGLLKQAEDLFNIGDILNLYLFPEDFNPRDIPKDLIRHYLDKTPDAKKWINEETEGYGALSKAVCHEDKEMVELLLEYGASANIYASDGDDDYGTVLGLALEKENEEIIKLLLKYGARASDLIDKLPESFQWDNSPIKLLKDILMSMGKYEDIAIIDEVLNNDWESEETPENLDSEWGCFEAVMQNGINLKYVPMSFRTENICLIAVGRNGYALEYVPDNLKTEEFYRKAVALNGMPLASLPDNLKTEEFYRKVVELNGMALKLIPEDIQTEKICVAAVKQNDKAWKYTPRRIRTPDFYKQCFSKETPL